MKQYPGVHDRRLGRTVIPSGDRDHEPILVGTELPCSLKQCQIHRSDMLPVSRPRRQTRDHGDTR